MLGSYRGLARDERVIARRAIRGLLAVRIGLSLLSLARLRARLARMAARHAPVGEAMVPTRLSAERIAFVVERVAHLVPGATCLVRALAAQALMARYGFVAHLRLGVARDQMGVFGAHAWLEYDGRVILGEDERRYFTPLMPASGQIDGGE